MDLRKNLISEPLKQGVISEEQSYVLDNLLVMQDRIGEFFGFHESGAVVTFLNTHVMQQIEKRNGGEFKHAKMLLDLSALLASLKDDVTNIECDSANIQEEETAGA